MKFETINLFLVCASVSAISAQLLGVSKYSGQDQTVGLRFVEEWEDSITLLEGSTLKLDCSATGATDYNWTLNGMHVIRYLERAVRIYGPKLRLPDISGHEVGVYECFASNEVESISRRIDVSVVYISKRKPAIDRHLIRNQTVFVGDSLAVQCEVDSPLTNTINWYFNDTRFIPSSTLALDYITAAEEGQYLCSATNSAGIDTYGFYLKVLPKPKHFKYFDTQDMAVAILTLSTLCGIVVFGVRRRNKRIKEIKDLESYLLKQRAQTTQTFSDGVLKINDSVEREQSPQPSASSSCV